MSDYDFWEEQEEAEREYDAQQSEIASAYDEGYEQGRADVIEEFVEFFRREYVFDSICRDDCTQAKLVDLVDNFAEQLKEQK